MTNTKNLPEYLQKYGRFCVWKYEADPKRDKPTKMPYPPYSPRQKADTSDAFTFSDMKTAEAAQKSFDGMGIRIQGNISGIDIDDCVTDGKLSEMAQDIVNQMDSYTEYSPSGKGIRILFLAHDFSYNTDTYYIKNSNIGLEVYIAGMTKRFLTVTGETIIAKDLEDRADRLQYILDKYMKRKQTITDTGTALSVEINLSDSELIKRAKTAKNGTEFALLMAGDWQGRYPSQSEADQAFCNLLAFWTGRDADRMDNIFRASGLYREKWERDDYRMRTINRAISACRDIYVPPTQDKLADSPTESVENTTGETEKTMSEQIVQPSQIDSALSTFETERYKPLSTGIREIDDIINGGFFSQTLVLIGSHPGAGKTTLCAQLLEDIANSGRADCVYCNLEMPTTQLLARSLSRMTGIDQLTVMQGYRWTDKQRESIYSAAEQYKNTTQKHFTYLETVTSFYEDILKTFEEKETHREDRSIPLVCCIDYIQLLRSKNAKEDVEIIKGSLKAFKDFAINHNAIVIMIMAHSRSANESGQSKLGAGRDTSSLEYSADLQLSINYSAIINGQARDKDDMKTKINNGKIKPDAWSQFTLLCTKNRFGRSSEDRGVNMIMDGEHSRFRVDGKGKGETSTTAKPRTIEDLLKKR